MKIARRLSEELTLIRTPLFPSVYRPRGLSHRALIGIGGNLGDVLRRFERLLLFLQRSPLVRPLSASPLLKNPPFGFTEQPAFLNAALLIETSLQPRALMRYLLRVEHRFGRLRTFANAPRTLDLDMLFYDQRRIDTPELTVPHPHWAERQSVLIPLAYLSSEGVR